MARALQTRLEGLATRSPQQPKIVIED